MQEITYLHSYFGIETDKKVNLSESHLKRSDQGFRICSMSWKVPWLQSAGTANPRESPMCDWVKQGNTFAGTSNKGNKKPEMNMSRTVCIQKHHRTQMTRKRRHKNENEMTTNLMMTSTKIIQRAMKMGTNEPRRAGSFTQEKKSQCVDGEANIKWNVCVFCGFFCNFMSYVLLNVSVNKPSTNCDGGNLLMHSRYVNLIGHILYSPLASCQSQPFLAGVKKRTSTSNDINTWHKKYNTAKTIIMTFHTHRGDSFKFITSTIASSLLSLSHTHAQFTY